MVGDNTERNVLFRILLVGDPGNAADVLHNILHRIHLKQVVHALHHACQTLQPHAGVDVLVLHFCVVPLAVAVELAEYQIPYLNKPVTFAAHLTIGRTAALFRTPVKVDFRAGTAGTGAMLPEVILLAQSGHMIRRNADMLGPDVVSLIVLFVYGNVQLVHRQLQHLGEKLPCPLNGFGFEVIPKGEVPQHFKVGTVTGSLAHTFNIRGTNTLLTGGNTHIGRCRLPQEIFLQRCHAGIDQKETVVPLGDQGRTVHPGMPLTLKK